MTKWTVSIFLKLKPGFKILNFIRRGRRLLFWILENITDPIKFI